MGIHEKKNRKNSSRELNEETNKQLFEIEVYVYENNCNVRKKEKKGNGKRNHYDHTHYQQRESKDGRVV